MRMDVRLAGLAFAAGIAASAVGSASAAVLTTSSIAPFDTTLGTLQQVTVTLDPGEATTSNFFTVEDPILDHAHTALTPPITIAGLGTFTFAPTPTSIANSEAFDQHNHTLDVGPTTEVFTGSGLDWFLDPSNPTITAINITPFLVVAAQGHQHQVVLPAIAPDVTYVYEPIPEPAAASLVTLAGLLCLRRRANR